MKKILKTILNNLEMETFLDAKLQNLRNIPFKKI